MDFSVAEQQETQHLFDLLIQNKIKQVKTRLDQLHKRHSTKFKGNVFECFLQQLFQAQGWQVDYFGGKDDNGVDLILSLKQKNKFLIQAKNQITRLNKADTLKEYEKFYGGRHRHGQTASQQYQCNQLIIISINGFVKDAEKCRQSIPKNYEITHLDWHYIRDKLIIDYLKQVSPADKLRVKIKKIRPYFFTFIIISIAYLLLNNYLSLPSPTTEKNPLTLSKAQQQRLNQSVPKLSPSYQRLCDKNNWQNDCKIKIVALYSKKYGSLANGLNAFICGEPAFKNKSCSKVSLNVSWRILTAENN